MNRDRVVNATTDAFFGEALHNMVPILNANGIDMIHVPGIGSVRRDSNRFHVLKGVIVSACVSTAK